VLDERGNPCPPGEMGRVVITDLHNFATPLIRYDIGDFAEPALACSCGRGLPVLSRIVGRARNLLVAPDGRRRYPFIGQSQYLDIAPIVQHQVVQTSLHRVEVRIVMREPPTQEQVERLRAHVAAQMPADIDVEVVQVERLPRGPGGKYEDFISLVDS